MSETNSYTFAVKAAVTVYADSVAEAKEALLAECMLQEEDVLYGPNNELSVYLITPWRDGDAKLLDENE